MWNTVMCSVDKTCLSLQFSITRPVNCVVINNFLSSPATCMLFLRGENNCYPSKEEQITVVRLSRASIGHYRDIDSTVFSVYLYFLSGSKCSISASLRSPATLSQR